MNRTEQKQKTLRSINYLAIKCNEDVSFKRKLFEDPIGTISKLDQNFRFDTGKIQKFEDQTDRSIIFLNIPQQPTLDDFELKEEELEKVSGGGSWDLNCLANVIDALIPDNININIQIGDNNTNQQGIKK